VYNANKRDGAAIFSSYKHLFRFIVSTHQPVVFLFGEKAKKRRF
jgi:hypothetical protein